MEDTGHWSLVTDEGDGETDATDIVVRKNLRSSAEVVVVGTLSDEFQSFNCTLETSSCCFLLGVITTARNTCVRVAYASNVSIVKTWPDMHDNICKEQSQCNLHFSRSNLHFLCVCTAVITLYNTTRSPVFCRIT